MKFKAFLFVLLVGAALSIAAWAFVPEVVDAGVTPEQQHKITVRTENYPRPPYSGATYYIYEQDDKVICTKLETCNKLGNCSSEYKKGSYKADEDVETGAPYDHTDPVVIQKAKLKKHTCLTRCKLVP